MRKEYLDFLRDRESEIASSKHLHSKAFNMAARSALDAKVRRAFFGLIYEQRFGSEAIERRAFLNIGPGSFRHSYWRTADKAYSNGKQSWTQMRRGLEQYKPDYIWDVYERAQFPEKDGFFKVIYNSHVVEHLFDDDARFLFQEMHRLLESGGRVRIVCPDSDLMIKAYDEKNYWFFLHYLMVASKRRLISIEAIEHLLNNFTIEEFILEWVSLLANDKNDIYFKKHKAKDFIESYDNLYAAFEAASEMSSKEVNRDVGGHVNWFNFDKLQRMLKGAGFEDVYLSGYIQSREPVLWDTTYFDRTDPEMSLYVEAIKR